VIIANAFPKCGTNVVKKILGGLGLEQQVGQIYRMVPQHRVDLRKAPYHVSLRDVYSMDNDHFVHAHMAWNTQGFQPSGADNKMIYIQRDPRNALVSLVRWAASRGKIEEESESYLIYFLEKGAYEYAPWIEGWRNYQRWIGQPGVCDVTFESVFSDGGGSVEKVAKFVGADTTRVDEVYTGLFGNGKQIKGRDVYKDASTWSGGLSDWQTYPHWTPHVQAVWDRHWNS
jgi:hypothetical protein